MTEETTIKVYRKSQNNLFFIPITYYLLPITYYFLLQAHFKLDAKSEL